MVLTTNLFEAFSRLNILVVGDVMIDRYLTGTVDRISPEAPVPVVRLERSDNRLGGAANVALNLKALGATPYLASVLGQDSNADIFLEILPKYGLSNRTVIQSSERKTTIKTRVLAQHQHLLRVDQEDTHPLSEKESQVFLNRIKELLDQREIHAILFQDYNKGVLSQKVISEIILEAIKRDIPTSVDPKFQNFWSYKHVSLFKPNLKEIRAQVPFEVSVDLPGLEKTAAYIERKLGNQFTVITLSEKGLFVHSKSGGTIVPTQARQIADVCGAGDTVISMVTLGLALGIDMQAMAVLANIAGGQVCERVGVVPVDAEQLRKEYEAFITHQDV